MREWMSITKKFINDPKTVVDDSLAGVVRVNREIISHARFPRVALRADYKDHCNNSRVSLIAGGGSGHEPFAAGFVGAGMLTAAICGDVFASPPSNQILAALEETKTPGGTILFVINYTGDRLNFGLAAVRYRSKGGNVRVITIRDDIAIEEGVNRIGPRGLAGAVLVIKVAGAMAEQGCGIDEIEKAVNTVNQHIYTIGVSLKPCSLPGREPMFQLESDKMEIGLGIHGEPGKMRCDTKPTREIVADLMSHLKSAMLKGRNSQDSTDSIPSVLLLNNLGGVSQLEMHILQGDILNWCQHNNLPIARLITGPFMTSLDGHGVSITLFNVQHTQQLKYIDFPCSAPGWIPAVEIESFDQNRKTNTSSSALFPVEENTVQFENGKPLLLKMVIAVCREMRNREGELNQLDGRAGDGDCGSTFTTAAQVIENSVEKKRIPLDSPQKLLDALSEIFENEVGGTSGALYAILLSTAGNCMPEMSSKSLGDAIRAATESIKTYGGARPGDRTMVDTLQAVVNELPQSTNEKVNWERIVKAAELGARSTASMKAAAGRASYTAQEVQTEPDAGAMAIFYWMKTIYEATIDA